MSSSRSIEIGIIFCGLQVVYSDFAVDKTSDGGLRSSNPCRTVEVKHIIGCFAIGLMGVGPFPLSLS